MFKKLEKIIIQNIREIPEVPLSLLLSGGIDSSLVLALLRKVYPKVPIATFTLAGSKDYPDMFFAREVADLFKTQHNEIILSDEEYKQFLYEYNKVKQHDFKGDINVYILCSFAKAFGKNFECHERNCRGFRFNQEQSHNSWHAPAHQRCMGCGSRYRNRINHYHL